MSVNNVYFTVPYDKKLARGLGMFGETRNKKAWKKKKICNDGSARLLIVSSREEWFWSWLCVCFVAVGQIQNLKRLYWRLSWLLEYQNFLQQSHCLSRPTWLF